MRILIAAPVPREREGGVSNVVHNMAEGLRGRGHEVTCVFNEDILTRPGGSARFGSARFAVRLAQEISKRQSEFDVVNIHAPAGFAYGILRRWRRASSLPPCVMLLHGIEERRTHAMLREARKGRAWHFRWKNRAWRRLYHLPQYRWSMMTADQSIVINRETWSMLQLKYNLDAERVWYIPNGVEPRYFVPREYREGPALRLLFVGTWLDHKGVYYLRDGFEKLVQRLPELRLTIAGSRLDEESIRDWFSPAARDRVDILPFVPTTEMPALYQKHDIFVLPSLMEGLPVVLLEAMAGGMPVVSTETCGMMDMIEDGYNGLLAKPADTDGLVEAIERMVESRELRWRLGCAAKKTMERQTWEQVAVKLEKVFALAAAEGKIRGD